MDRENTDKIFRKEYQTALEFYSNKKSDLAYIRDYHPYFPEKTPNGPPANYSLILKEHYFFNKDNPISCNFHVNIPAALSWHSHDFFEIIYVYCGRITHFIDHATFELSEGDICITNPNTIHALSKVEENTIVFNLLIKKEILNNAFFLLLNTDNIIFNFFSDCLYGHNSHTQILFPKAHSDCLIFLHNIIVEYFQKKPEFKKAMEYNLQLLCLELTREYIKMHTDDVYHSDKNANVEQILRYIADNFRTATIDSIAENFQYHPTYLPQLLKKHTGKTFMEIQQQFRTCVAKDKLLHSNDSIEEICKYAGYSNPTHFYRIFKKLTGLSPLQYRKKYSDIN